MAEDKGDSVVLTTLQRTKVAHAMETHMNVIKRRINAEKSEDIKKILKNDLDFLADISRKFVL
jgi:hypothetical protein